MGVCYPPIFGNPVPVQDGRCIQVCTAGQETGAERSGGWLLAVNEEASGKGG